MDFSSRLSAAFGRLQRGSYKWFLLLTVLCLALGENYPFSNFPMYSSFGRHSYFLYLTDSRGEAIRSQQFGISSSTMKKIFDRAYRLEFTRTGKKNSAAAEQSAGKALLGYLDGLTVNQPVLQDLLRGSRVEHVEVSQRDDQLLFETRELARHP